MSADWLEAFQDWLTQQAGRDDPVGWLTEQVSDREHLLESIRDVDRERPQGRHPYLDAFRVAVREWRAEVDLEQRSRAVLTLERLVFELLVKFHAETNACQGGNHCHECQALVMGAFGYPSWKQWVETAAVLPSDDEPSR